MVGEGNSGDATVITYLICLLFGFVGIGVVFAGRKNEWIVVLGAAIYFVALFVAAINSMHGVL